MIYVQFLHALITKAQNESQVISAFFAHLGSAHGKAAHKTLMKLTPGLAAGEKNEVC